MLRKNRLMRAGRVEEAAENQYAFRPTGSTTAALAAIYHTVCTMLSNNQYIRVFVLDFSKAFDSIRHNQLFAKMSAVSIPDEIYNWITHFLLTEGTVPNLACKIVPEMTYYVSSGR